MNIKKILNARLKSTQVLLPPTHPTPQGWEEVNDLDAHITTDVQSKEFLLPQCYCRFLRKLSYFGTLINLKCLVFTGNIKLRPLEA